MKHLISGLIFTFCWGMLFGQYAKLNGNLKAEDGEPIIYANVLLYDSQDSVLVKTGLTNEKGDFSITGLEKNSYYLEVTYIGYDNFVVPDISIQDTDVNLGEMILNVASVQLAETTITARRAMMEVKSDRTVFNVEGTINSVGDNAIGLLRKAPGVLVDNNNNISVLSRSGVLIYVDGKRLPLTGSDLTAYLENLPAEQIDRMDIITNPGAKYEAQGNAGIIDIRLKKNKNFGTNGTVNSTYSQGRFGNGNIGLSGNYRNGSMNTFGSIGFNKRRSYHQINFDNLQNGLLIREDNYSQNDNNNGNIRLGSDLNIGKNHTIGFLASGQLSTAQSNANNNIIIYPGSSSLGIDSSLLAQNIADQDRDQATFNLNYVFDDGKNTINIDADYGTYTRDNNTFQPNQYYAADGVTPLTRIDTRYLTPVGIDIYTFKVDVERPFGGGKLGFGTKLSRVVTRNTFLFYDIENNTDVRNDRRSNQFDYDENVYAGYVNFSKALSEKWNFSSGLRVEKTDALGNLQAFVSDLSEPPVELNYTSFFPSIGLTYTMSEKHMLALNYGRRINRPDYNVLNPFKEQQTELSFHKGNPFLSPEIVDNIELGYTLNYRYNFKLSYSKTTDQITRLIGPDAVDPRANFVSWDNLASQTIIGGNISAPFELKSWWNAFVNFSSGYLDNQADYGDGGIVDVQAFTYSIFQQHTLTLPGGFIGEVSGYFSGPGVWGGVFKYDETWSLNLGLQKKFMADQMNVRISAQDIFYQTGWTGTSSFNGLEGSGGGNWDSRRVSLSMSYNFGNNKVKSRNRKTGIESESSRVGQ